MTDDILDRLGAVADDLARVEARIPAEAVERAHLDLVLEASSVAEDASAEIRNLREEVNFLQNSLAVAKIAIANAYA